MHIKGIHHITAISSNVQKTYDFYSKILGLRLVKRSVNQDDISTYHLFFGNKIGSPGMDLTFFPFQPAFPGRRGNGLVTTISFAVPVDSLKFWKKRFEKLHVSHKPISKKFDLQRLVFYDQDNQRLELVEVTRIEEEYIKNIWINKNIPQKHTIHSFHSATLSVSNQELIKPVLDLFGFTIKTNEGENYLYQITGRINANYLEVEDKPTEQAINAAGTVHHIAFEVENRAIQENLRLQVVKLGLQPTEVIDRFYFTSVYFRTPASILFEIATHGPGFTADEETSMLGKKLALPPFLENYRMQIETNLPSLVTV